MNFIKKLTLAAMLTGSIFSEVYAQESKYQWKESSAAGYTYKYVTNDPTNARYYTLKNGLTVILSPSKDQPRIQTYIATKAGSKTDPANHTGLAHYLEHMLFKGTDKFGTLDWAKEKPLLDAIDNLYDKYNKTTDEASRKVIYKQIDSVSGEAAKFAIPNEYDKLMSAMGAKGTNAFTSFEQTVYVEDIPANVVDKFLAVQAERFRNPILRLFHTELEAVYEEKNRGLDNDGRKSIEAMFAALFPHNNYGQQTTIGTIEHLKNPSLTAIRDYFHTYYVPNNMGIIMSGDFNPDEIIKKIDKDFAYMQPKEIPPYVITKEADITSPVVKEVFGPNPENIMIGFRFPGATDKDAQVLELLSNILTNGSAGLIDLNLVKQQKLLSAYAFPYVLKDYSMLILQGNPTEGQSLDEVKTLLFQQLDKLKKGDFSDDLISSIVNNEKKYLIERNENYTNRGKSLMDDFTSDIDHAHSLNYVNVISNITKADIMSFASKYLKESNYVAVYKRKGADKDIVKVEKPTITPVTLNTKDQSPFLKSVNAMNENPIAPVWLDYNNDVKKGKLGNSTEVLSVKNTTNGLFSLTYYFESGKWSNKYLPIAAEYLKFLGTNSKTAQQITEDFYKLASSFSISAGNEVTYVSLEGLDENFTKSVTMFEDLIRNAKADQTALDAYKARLKKSRVNAKQNKDAIMAGLKSYAEFGANNPFNNTLSDAELDALKAEDLVAILKDLLNHKHSVLYYGPKDNAAFVKSITPLHKLPKTLKEFPAGLKYEQNQIKDNSVLFANYDMVQAEVFWSRANDKYDANLAATSTLFNNYFGGGMGSIVFQTIRESKALAYSTYAYFANPTKLENRATVGAYVGTQSDKFKEAVTGMNELINVLPKSDQAVDNAKESVLKSLASQRITKESIIFSYLNAKKLGLNYDIRKNVFEKVPTLNFTDLQTFHKNQFSQKPFTYCIVANDKNVSMEEMNKIGKVKVLTLQEIFGY